MADDVLIIGSNSVRERLRIDVMPNLRDALLKSSNEVKEALSSDQGSQVAMARSDAEVMKNQMAQVGQLAIALEGVQAATGKDKIA